KARGEAFERGPDLDHAQDLLLALARDHDAAARHGADIALAFQKRQRLAHRRARHAQLLRQAALVEPDRLRLTIDIHPGDQLLEPSIVEEAKARWRLGRAWCGPAHIIPAGARSASPRRPPALTTRAIARPSHPSKPLGALVPSRPP